MRSTSADASGTVRFSVFGLTKAMRCMRLGDRKNHDGGGDATRPYARSISGCRYLSQWRTETRLAKTSRPPAAYAGADDRSLGQPIAQQCALHSRDRRRGHQAFGRAIAAARECRARSSTCFGHHRRTGSCPAPSAGLRQARYAAVRAADGRFGRHAAGAHGSATRGWGRRRPRSSRGGQAAPAEACALARPCQQPDPDEAARIRSWA